MDSRWAAPAVLLAAAALAGCNTTKAMVVPKAKPAVSSARLETGQSTATVALDRIVSTIGRRQPIFAFPANPTTSGTNCNYRLEGDQNVSYSGGREYLGDWSSDLGAMFHEEMTRRGYDVAGDPDAVFSRAQSVAAAEYLVAGRLTGMKGNFCHQHHFWSLKPTGEYSGELFVSVEWSVLNTLTDQVVLKDVHNGYFRQEEPIKDGVLATFESAFADSIAKFAASPALIALAKGEATPNDRGPKATPGSVAVTNGASPDGFEIAGLAGVIVTVKVGKGHGSGFFIGREGYALTNAHVVGDARQVRVKLANGLEAPARVVHADRRRDIALLKAEIGIPKAAAIAAAPPAVAATVYAVGSPLDETLAATVTRGIVSAHRREQATGLAYIQADAAISPGNSGGPLFDDAGRIVGVAVAKLAGRGAEGLNLFVPIADALDSVGVVVR